MFASQDESIQATRDRRGAQRRRVAYRLDVSAPSGGGSGCLLDVSATGLRLRFKGGFDMSASQALRIDFPRWLELGSGLEVHGRFVWVRQCETGATEAGFAFDPLSRKDRNLLELLIQRLAEAVLEDQAA